MDDATRRKLLDLVDAWIRDRVRGARLPRPKEADAIADRCGVFVTLRVAGALRGCIGSLEPTGPLGETAFRIAESSLEDPRFLDRPVRPEELPELVVELMTLGPLRRIAGVEDVEIGRHGVVVEAAGQVGVFLPQVAVEHGWSAEETLDHLCTLKLRMPASTWRLPGAKLSVFEASKVASEAG